MRQGLNLNVKRMLIGSGFASLLAVAPMASADTVAYWNFEDGIADGEELYHNAVTHGQYSEDIFDKSGNGNHASVWQTGGGAGYTYRNSVPNSTVPGAGDASNNFSVKNTGGGPAMWTNKLQDWAPTAWTIEVSFKVEAGGYRTFVGRDSLGGVVNGPDPNVAALYFQKQDNESLAIKFLDGAGTWHQAATPANFIQGFNFGNDPNGSNAPWYSAAAVSDGNTLSLYLLNHSTGDTEYSLVAQTDLTASGSADTSLSTGHGDGGDWDAGDFTFGRGLHGGGHGDRAYGYLDEIRFSDEAISDFLFGSAAVPEPASLAILGLGGLALFARRRHA